MHSDLLSGSEEQTFDFARRLAESLTLPAHILLFGDLGAGKTTFTKGLASGFGVEDVGDVTSPTFALVNQYQGRMPIFHIDLYRIDSGDFDGLGLEEMFDSPDAVVVVEWAERLGHLAPTDAIRIDLSYVGESERKIIVHRAVSEDAPDGESK